jgi:cytidylate kinase|tara:strand:- start:111 stop:758 length:648 start_codon:yes stop_codon:yes gene_type:complete
MTIVIAIDGLAGSGKGTIAKNISSFYNFPHLDSGILYRSVAYLCHKGGENVFDEKRVLKYAQNLNIEEIDVDKLRTEEIDQISSKISSFSSVRESLKIFQLNFKKIHSDKSGIVIDGRDITTVIFPDAEIKFYVTASLKDRANRRFEELVLNNPKIDKKLVIKELQKRDQRDMERSVAPLKIAKDAIVIDTSDLTIEEVNIIVQREIEKVISKKE